MNCRELPGNKFTGAGSGICKIVGHNWDQDCGSSGYDDCCILTPNPAWKDGAQCPTCLNTGACKAPVTCTTKVGGLLEDNIAWKACVASGGSKCPTNTELDLLLNELSGTIPGGDVEKMTALTSMNLASNKISGTLPSTYSKLVNLHDLDVHDNELTGAGDGICTIVKTLGASCDVSTNPAWNDPTMCPKCMNVVCKSPIQCSGANKPTPAPTTPSPTPVPTTPQPTTPQPTTPQPTSAVDNCKCDTITGGSCDFGPNTTAYPHAGACHGYPTIKCDCKSCDAQGKKNEFCTPPPSPPAPATAWEKFETKLCFGIPKEAEDAHCGDIVLAAYLALAFAFLAFFVVEFVMIPSHALRESCVNRVPYGQALRHAWLHQCWCFALIPCCGVRLCRGCARRAEPVLADEDGNRIPWVDWSGAREAQDRLRLEGGEMGVSANLLLNAPLLRDTSTADLEAELNTRKMGNAIMRDASTSELEMILTAVRERREQDAAAAAAPAGMQIMDVMEEAGGTAAMIAEEDGDEELLGVD